MAFVDSASNTYGHVHSIVKATIAILFALSLTPRQGAASEAPLLVAFGDSLTAGYGLAPEQAFPVRLEAYLNGRGLSVTIQNAGVSGDTTAGGRSRLDWALADKPKFILVELGANDALRAIDPKETEANLEAILSELDSRGVKVLLAGMRAPPNLGRDYDDAFDQLYARLAAKHHALLYPFFLDGVAGDASLNQADGLHPNPRGVAIIVQRIAPFVEKLIRGE
jgi:acyl-CoA thioesterase-1